MVAEEKAAVSTSAEQGVSHGIQLEAGWQRLSEIAAS
jgi:hypothetical protein